MAPPLTPGHFSGQLSQASLAEPGLPCPAKGAGQHCSPCLCLMQPWGWGRGQLPPRSCCCPGGPIAADSPASLDPGTPRRRSGGQAPAASPPLLREVLASCARAPPVPAGLSQRRRPGRAWPPSRRAGTGRQPGYKRAVRAPPALARPAGARSLQPRPVSPVLPPSAAASLGALQRGWQRLAVPSPPQPGVSPEGRAAPPVLSPAGVGRS